MLSMGRFETEIDLIIHPTMRECLRYCKLIGNDNDTDALQEYANNLTRRYVEEQVQFFPNTQRVIDYWIVTAHELFCSVIVRDELPITEMPPVLLSNLLASNLAKDVNYRMTLKEALINAAFSEIGDSAISNGVPSKQQLQSTSPTYTLQWK